MNHTFRKHGSILFLVILIFSMSFMHPEIAEEKTTSSPLKKIRVGYLTYQGYQEGEGNAPKSGYGYEYLQQIAYYAGWEYEYVNGSNMSSSSPNC